jgi:Leucine-rich repeat (LRR) protein
MHALWSLKDLEMSNMQISDLPAIVTINLKQLTFLDLSGNGLTQLPSSISQITTLDTLHVNGNTRLQLKPGDVDTLVALPQLRSLGLGSKVSGLVLRAISKRLPAVKVYIDKYG